MSRQSKDVKVLSTDVVQDENGTAAVVRMRNTGSRRWRRSRSRSTCAGRARASPCSATTTPASSRRSCACRCCARARSSTWVNDQVAAAEKPRAVKAKVGEAKAVRSEHPRRSRVTRPRLEQDPVSGVAAVGFAANRSKVEQRKLVIFAVARKGGRVVAAGRAQINRVKPRKRTRYTIFFIGNPRGARISLEAPPTSLNSTIGRAL